MQNYEKIKMIKDKATRTQSKAAGFYASTYCQLTAVMSIPPYASQVIPNAATRKAPPAPLWALVKNSLHCSLRGNASQDTIM